MRTLKPYYLRKRLPFRDRAMPSQRERALSAVWLAGLRTVRERERKRVRGETDLAGGDGTDKAGRSAGQSEREEREGLKCVVGEMKKKKKKK